MPPCLARSVRPLPAAAFTLIELLVSMSVLTLLILLVSQLTDAAATTVANSGKYIDADTQARLVFSRMEVDFDRMVKRPDVDYSTFKSGTAGTLPSPPYASSIATNTQGQPGNDFLAFYTETAGYYSGSGTAPTGIQKSAVSLVAYNMATDPYNQNGQVNVLRRLGKTLGWEPNSTSWQNMTYLPTTLATQWPNLFNSTQQDADYQTVGNMVFRVEYTYLLKPSTTGATALPARLSITPWNVAVTPAHTSINGFQDVAAIVVAIAVLDPTSRAVVQDYSKLTSNKIFTDAVEGSSDPNYGGDIAAAWNAAIHAPTFASSANIPVRAASAVHIYQKYFYLDSTPGQGGQR